MTEAIRLAGAYTHAGIETATPIGSGFGPLNHIHSITPRLITPYVTGVVKHDNQLTALNVGEPRRIHSHSQVLSYMVQAQFGGSMFNTNS